MSSGTAPLLEVRNVKKWFPVAGRKGMYIKAVDGVSLEVYPGETVGVVGESGCGKSTLGYLINRLYEPTDGRIIFRGQDITFMKRRQLREACALMKMVFQDPNESLDPRMCVEDIIAEPMRIRGISGSERRENRVREVMDIVGLDPESARRYPHEFSGGQRQRIGIARAIVLEPELVICDEPVSALDVSIQARIINLLRRLQDTMGIAYLFISHDLNVVKYISDRIIVMYLGQVMESAGKDELYTHPLHPYTRALLSSIPLAEHTFEFAGKLTGEVPSPMEPPSGCRFHTRCPYARPQCSVDTPAMREIIPGHTCACHFAGEI